MNKKDRIQSRLNKGKYKTHYDYTTALSNLYREQLQKKPTESELRFRDFLDNHGVKYKFQKTFLKPFHRIVDFYIPKRKLIIEIDGGYHKSTASKDDFKDMLWLKERKMNTLRITNEAVDNLLDIH